MSKPLFLYCTGTAYALDLFGEGVKPSGSGASVTLTGLDGATFTGPSYVTDDPFWKMVDQDLWDARKVEYPAAIFPFSNSVDRGVKMVIDMIKAHQGQFALGGYSQGAMVMTRVYEELRYGSLKKRRKDLVAAVMFGNPLRHTDALWPEGSWSGRWDVADSTTGGHGCFPENHRMKEAPDELWWEFVNVGDIITAVGDTTGGDGGLAMQAAASILTLEADLSNVVGLLTGHTPINPSALLNRIKALPNLNGHMLYPVAPPPGDPRDGMTSYQIALTYLREVGQKIAATPTAAPDGAFTIGGGPHKFGQNITESSIQDMFTIKMPGDGVGPIQALREALHKLPLETLKGWRGVLGGTNKDFATTDSAVEWIISKTSAKGSGVDGANTPQDIIDKIHEAVTGDTTKNHPLDTVKDNIKNVLDNVFDGLTGNKGTPSSGKKPEDIKNAGTTLKDKVDTVKDNIQQTVDNIHQAVNGGTETNKPIETVKQNLQDTWTKIWDGLTGGGGTTTEVKKPADIQTAATVLKSVATTADSNASAAQVVSTSAQLTSENLAGHGNLVISPNFDMIGITRQVFGTPTHGYSNDQQYLGNWSYRFTTTAAAVQGVYLAPTMIRKDFDCKPGEVFVASVMVKGKSTNNTSAGKVLLTMKWYDKNTYLTETYKEVNSSDLTGWTEISGVGTAPAYADSVQVLVVADAATPVGSTFYIDSARVAEETRSQATKDDLQQTVDNIAQAVTGGTSIGNTIGSVKSNLNQAWANIWDGLTGGVGTVSKIPADVATAAGTLLSTANTAQTTANTANAVATGTQTTIEAISGHGNLVISPNFDMIGITRVGWGTTPPIHGYSNDQKWIGNWSYKWTTTVADWQGVYLAPTQAKLSYDVRPGDVFRCTVMIKPKSTNGTAGTVRLQVRFYNNGAYVSDSVSIINNNALSAWVEIGGYVTVPDTADTMQVFVISDNATPVGNVYYIDAAIVREETQATYAKALANTATTNAATAQTTANTGVSNAATAQSTANTAQTSANTAQSTANTATTSATTANTSVQATIDGIVQAVKGGTYTGNATAEVKAALALSYANMYDGLNGTTGSTAKLPTDVQTVAGTVKSTANTANTTANTATANVQTTVDAIVQAVDGGTATGNSYTAPKTKLGQAWANFWDGLNGTSGATSKLPSDVKTVAGTVRSKAVTADSNATTAITNASTAQSTADTASTTANTATTNLQTVVDGVVQAVDGGTSTGNAHSTSKTKLQLAWARVFDGLSGNTAGTNTSKLPSDVATAGGTVRSSATTAGTNASTALTNAANAQTSANGAQTTANTAQANANTANTNANTAAANAATAQNTANKVDTYAAIASSSNNVITDPDFTDTTVRRTGLGYTTFYSVAGEPAQGGYSLKYIAPAGYPKVSLNQLKADGTTILFPVSSGQVFTYDVWIQAKSTNSGSGNIEFGYSLYTADGTSYGVTVAKSVAVTKGSWQRLQGTFTIPTYITGTAVPFSMAITAGAASVTAGDTFFFDRVFVYR